MSQPQLAKNDLTELRMRIIAGEACFYCHGRKTHSHQSLNMRVQETVKFDKERPDKATALFRMTRGAVIVTIGGMDEWRWFWPTVDSAMAAYTNGVSELLKS